MKQKGLIVSSDNLLSSYKDLSDIEFVIIRLGFTDFNTKKTNEKSVQDQCYKKVTTSDHKIIPFQDNRNREILSK